MSMSERRAPTPSPDHRVIASNLWIAERLSRFADLLDQQGGDRFRIRAYRAGADEIRALSVPLADIHAQGGMDGLFAKQRVVGGQAGGKGGHRRPAQAAMQDAARRRLGRVLMIKKRGAARDAGGRQIQHGRLKPPLKGGVVKRADLVARDVKIVG